MYFVVSELHKYFRSILVGNGKRSEGSGKLTLNFRFASSCQEAKKSLPAFWLGTAGSPSAGNSWLQPELVQGILQGTPGVAGSLLSAEAQASAHCSWRRNHGFGYPPAFRSSHECFPMVGSKLGTCGPRILGNVFRLAALWYGESIKGCWDCVDMDKKCVTVRICKL